MVALDYEQVVAGCSSVETAVGSVEAAVLTLSSITADAQKACAGSQWMLQRGKDVEELKTMTKQLKANLMQYLEQVKIQARKHKENSELA